MSLIFVLAASFLTGSLPTAYLAVKWLKGTDIREHGSGNVGATNAGRLLGKKAAIVIFAIDFMKGFAPVALTRALTDVPSFEFAAWLPLAAGGAAILGHVFTPFLGFKGGKGVATGAGVLCGLYPPLFLAGLGAWGIAFAFTRVVSVSSLCSVVSVFVLSLFLNRPAQESAFYAAGFFFLVWTHRSNLRRLKAGTEKRQ